MLGPGKQPFRFAQHPKGWAQPSDKSLEYLRIYPFPRHEAAHAMATILVVDDYAPVRFLLERILKAAGHDVVHAEDGFQALALAGGAPFDLVLSDLHMPNLDGIGLVRLLRGMDGYARVPILLVTKSDDEEQRQKALALGATDWMVKPFSPENLMERVNQALAPRGSSMIAKVKPSRELELLASESKR